jgi:tetratricopeptide (TPR) repeat protein
MVLDLRGTTVVFVGRLAALARPLAVRHVEARGGWVRQGLTRRTDVLVVGQCTHTLLEGGHLQRKIERADQLGVRCISENGFLRGVGLLPRPAGNRDIDLRTVGTQCGLDEESLRLLALFDVIEPHDDLCSFADLLAARAASRLMQQGLSLSAVLRGMQRVRQQSPTPGRALPSLVRDGREELAIKVGGVLADLDGQLRLPLPDAGNLDADAAYDAAERAEDEQDWASAERLYRLCMWLNRSDPTPPFNLGSLLAKLGRSAQAKLHLQLATAIDPDLSEAWYNLAHLAEAEGDPARARAHLRRALAADPDYADALYNLASLCYQAGEYAEAASLWDRYLSLDPRSAWGEKARRGAALCRQHLLLERCHGATGRMP